MFCRGLQLARTATVLDELAAAADASYRRRQAARRPKCKFTARQIQIAITALANIEARAALERSNP